MRTSSTEVIKAMASTASVTTTTTTASHPVSIPSRAAPQILPSGNSAAAMPV